MLVDNALEYVRSRRVIPDAIGVNHGKRPMLADAEAVGLGAEDALGPVKQFEFGQAPFEVVPTGEALFLGAALRLGLIGAKEDVALDATDLQIAGDQLDVIFFLVGHTRFQMTASEFDRLVEKAMERIPARFRKRLHNLAFVVEKEPPRPGLLGLYQGRPLPLRSVAEPFAMPDVITIYQGPHERMAMDEDHLRRVVEETVWHEVAHYFGLNEAEVQRAERRRSRERHSPTRRWP